jgi:GNAT superfamily N-acetyltransferase
MGGAVRPVHCLELRIELLGVEDKVKKLTMIAIRPYTDEDLDNVVALWYGSWSHAFPTLIHPQPFDQWKSRFQTEYSKQSGAWVAAIQDRVAGFVVVSDRIIAQIFVEVEMQGNGVGAALLNHAKTLYPSGLRLTTLQQNKQACRFYEKHGFIAGAAGVNPVNGQPNIEYYWRP